MQLIQVLQVKLDENFRECRFFAGLAQCKKLSDYICVEPVRVELLQQTPSVYPTVQRERDRFHEGRLTRVVITHEDVQLRVGSQREIFIDAVAANSNFGDQGRQSIAGMSSDTGDNPATASYKDGDISVDWVTFTGREPPASHAMTRFLGRTPERKACARVNDYLPAADG
ncbi:hypothetical protein D3C79_709590 [compost metagenome]